MEFWSDAEASLPPWQSLVPPDLKNTVVAGVSFASHEDPVGNCRILLFCSNRLVVELKDYVTVRTVKRPTRPDSSGEIQDRVEARAFFLYDVPTLNDHVVLLHEKLPGRKDGRLSLLAYDSLQVLSTINEVVDCSVNNGNTFAGPPKVEIQLKDGRCLQFDDVLRRLVSSSLLGERDESQDAEGNGGGRRVMEIRRVLNKNLMDELGSFSERIRLVNDSLKTVRREATNASVINKSTSDVRPPGPTDPSIRIMSNFFKAVDSKFVVGFHAVITIPEKVTVKSASIQLFPNVDLLDLTVDTYALSRMTETLTKLPHLGHLVGPGNFPAILIGVMDVPGDFGGDYLDFSVIFRLEHQSWTAGGDLALSWPWDKKVSLRMADILLSRCCWQWSHAGEVCESGILSVVCACGGHPRESLCLSFRPPHESKVLEVLHSLGYFWLPTKKLLLKPRRSTSDGSGNLSAGLLGASVLAVTDQLQHGGRTGWHCDLYSVERHHASVILAILQETGAKEASSSLSAKRLSHCPYHSLECTPGKSSGLQSQCLVETGGAMSDFERFKQALGALAEPESPSNAGQ